MTEKDFIAAQTARLADTMRNFPDDFIAGVEAKTITVPPVRLNLGEELFGTYEIIDTQGTTILSVGSQGEAKYIVYASRSRKSELPLPTLPTEVQKVTAEYERYLDDIIRQISQLYTKEFPTGKNAAFIATDILRALDLVRF